MKIILCFGTVFSPPKETILFILIYYRIWFFFFWKIIENHFNKSFKKRYNSFVFGFKIALEIAQVLRVHGNLPILI